MKKRMFLSTILMTLVLLVALTTATFAWYQVTATNKTEVATTTVELADDEYSIGDVTVKFTLSNVVGNPGPVDDQGRIFLEDQSGNLIAANGLYDTFATVTWTVTVLYDSEKMSQEEAYKQIEGDYTVKVSGTSLRFSDVNSNDAIRQGVDEIEVTFSLDSENIEEPSGQLFFAVSESVEEKATITISGQFQ